MKANKCIECGRIFVSGQGDEEVCPICLADAMRVQMKRKGVCKCSACGSQFRNGTPGSISYTSTSGVCPDCKAVSAYQPRSTSMQNAFYLATCK